jgi:hypothetical protein
MNVLDESGFIFKTNYLEILALVQLQHAWALAAD